MLRRWPDWWGVACVFGLIPAWLVGGCTADVEESASDRRLVKTVAMDGAEVVISAEVFHKHVGAHLTLSGGGRGALPDGFAWPRDYYRPRPHIAVRRNGEEINLSERHPSPKNWFRIGETFASRAGALDEVEAIKATVCKAPGRLAYRLKSPGYDSLWHGVYVKGQLAVHVKIDTEASQCDAVIPAFSTLEKLLGGSP